jgi:hypothetical protein
VTCSSETSVHVQTIGRHIPADGNLRNYWGKDLKSYNFRIVGVPVEIRTRHNRNTSQNCSVRQLLFRFGIGCDIQLIPRNYVTLLSQDRLLGPNQPPIQRVPGSVIPEVKRQGREADYAPQLVPKSGQRGSVHPLLHTSSWRSA